MVQTRSMTLSSTTSHHNIVTQTHPNPQDYDVKPTLKTSRGNDILNNAPYGALKRLQVHNYRRRRRYVYVPPPITLDEEQNEEIDLAAVIVGLNNRIFDLKSQLDVLYELYISEYIKRKEYGSILRKHNLISN
jgi:hypothetical protein